MGKLLKAVQSEDRRNALVELRDKIAATIELCESGRDMASLSKRLIEVMDEVDALDAAQAEARNPLQAAQDEFGDGG